MAPGKQERLWNKLRGGPRSSLGRAPEVLEEVLADLSLFPLLFSGMLQEDPVLRMRCADVAEKASRRHPDLLLPFHKMLLDTLAAIDQQELRWHVAQMLGYVDWTPGQREKALEILAGWIRGEKSRIVRVMALQSLADLSQADPTARRRAGKLLKALARGKIPSLASRARNILKRPPYGPA